MHFEEAVRFLLEKNPNPEEWDAAEWAAERPAVRVRSFFSSKVENARFLDRAQGLIFDYMTKVRDDVTGPDGEKTTALRVGGREDFVMLMRRFMIEEGMAKPEEFSKVEQGDVTDIRSMSRLRLIFDTNVRQAYGYGKWKQGMKPAVRRAFPAARFVRVRDVMAPRPRHADHLGEVRLKTDRAWWADYQNDPQIGGFGVPWEPYGFHSGMGQEDVSREEAERLGLRFDIREEEMETQPGLNDGLSAGTKGMDPELKRRLIEELEGMRPKRRRNIEEAAREAAAEARQRALERRGLAPVQSGPAVVVDEGDKITVRPSRESSLKPEANEVKLQPLSDEASEPDQGFDPQAVLSELRRIRGAEPEGAGLAREIRTDREAESLVEWADERGVLARRSQPPPEDDLTGGEHLVELNEAEGLVFKATKAGKFGFGVDREMIRPKKRREPPRITVGLTDATPDEYLTRLYLQNEEFGDEIQVLGVAKYPQGVSVLTAQPFYRGERTEQPVIDAWFSARGWTPVSGKEGGFYHPGKDLLILDALPRNVLTLEDGELMPFDVVIVRPTEEVRNSLKI